MNSNIHKTGWILTEHPEAEGWVSETEPTRIMPSKPSETSSTKVAPAHQDKPSRNGEGVIGDATVIAKKTPGLERATDRLSAQYLPKIGLQATSSSTKVWTAEISPLRLRFRTVLFKLTFPFRQRRTRVLSVICAVALLGVFFFSSKMYLRADAPKKAPQIVPGPAPKEEPLPPQVRAGDPHPKPAVDETGGIDHSAAPTQPIRLKHAADALVEGRWDEALHLYKTLAMRFPNDPSHRLAVKVLSRQDKGGSR